MTEHRLRTGVLPEVRAGVTLPGYDRERPPGIVHLGVGAFHKAHQAVCTDDSLQKSGGDWMITKQFALNAEMAYKRNDGHATITGPGPLSGGRIDTNASSFGFLFGVKMFF